MVRIVEDLASDWRRLDDRIDDLSAEIEDLAREDCGCERLMTVPGIGPIISSAVVAAIDPYRLECSGSRSQLRGEVGSSRPIRMIAQRESEKHTLT